jgi:hypothetical protein
MDSSDVQNALRLTEITPQALFASINIISRYVMEYGATDKTALDAIIRLRDLTEQGAVKDPAINDAIYSLCREAGLFPYLPKEKLNWRDQVALEFFRGPSETNYVFHREQWQAFQLLTPIELSLINAALN